LQILNEFIKCAYFKTQPWRFYLCIVATINDPAYGLFACLTQLKECYATYWDFELIVSSSYFFFQVLLLLVSESGSGDQL